MTVNGAFRIFKLSEKDIRKCCKDGMVKGAYKNKNRWIIPDETKIILTKKQVQEFLFQIIKFKNNPNLPISRELCETEEKTKILFDYLFELGLLGEYVFLSNIKSLFYDVQITDKGFELLMGSYYRKINVNLIETFNLININVGLVNL